MRTFLAVSLALVFAVVYFFGLTLNGPRGNLTSDAIAVFGVMAVIPLLLAALIAAVAVVRGDRPPLPHTTGTFGCLAVLLAFGVVWAFFVAVAMAASSG